MRIIFASTAFSQAAELSSFFADVEIVAVCNSFTDLLRVLREEREAHESGHREPVDAILLAENLDHKLDREGDGGEPLTLMRTIEQIRLIGPAELILVVNFSSTTLPDEDLRRFNIRPVIGDQVRIEGSPIQRYLDLRKIEGVSSIVVFAGLKGGVGRTTLALNYAASCVKDETRSTEEQVLLWDMDFHASTLRAILPDNAPLDLGIDDALNSASLEWEDVRRYIYPSSQSRLGFDILFAPEGVRDTIAFFQTNAGVRLLASKIARLLNEARLRYRTIVCDLGTDLFVSPLPAIALNQGVAGEGDEEQWCGGPGPEEEAEQHAVQTGVTTSTENGDGGEHWTSAGDKDQAESEAQHEARLGARRGRASEANEGALE